MLIGDEEAFACCRLLMEMTGICVGAQRRSARRLREILAEPSDNSASGVSLRRPGENYSSTIYNDEWLKQQGLRVSFEHLEGLRDISLRAPTQSKASSVSANKAITDIQK